MIHIIYIVAILVTSILSYAFGFNIGVKYYKQVRISRLAKKMIEEEENEEKKNNE